MKRISVINLLIKEYLKIKNKDEKRGFITAVSIAMSTEFGKVSPKWDKDQQMHNQRIFVTLILKKLAPINPDAQKALEELENKALE